MFCIKCGKQNDEKARFCCGCGVVFEEIENQAKQAQQHSFYKQPDYRHPPQQQFKNPAPPPQYYNQFQQAGYQQTPPQQFYQPPFQHYGRPIINNPQMYYQPLPSYGLSIASMILGIIAIVLFAVYYIALPCGIVGIVLGCISRSKAKQFGQKNSFATAGIICSSIGIALVFITLFIALSSIITDHSTFYL